MKHLNTKSAAWPPMAHLIGHHVKVQALMAGVQQCKTRVQEKEGRDDYVEQDLPRQALRCPGVSHQEQQGAGQHAVHCRAEAADSMGRMLHTADALSGLQVPAACISCRVAAEGSRAAGQGACDLPVACHELQSSRSCKTPETAGSRAARCTLLGQCWGEFTGARRRLLGRQGTEQLRVSPCSQEAARDCTVQVQVTTAGWL